MPNLKVDINTNPIPATILVPAPISYPSGGAVAGGVVITPNNPIVFIRGTVGPLIVPPNTLVQIADFPITLSGNRILTGTVQIGMGNWDKDIALYGYEVACTFDGVLPTPLTRIANQQIRIVMGSGYFDKSTRFGDSTPIYASTAGLTGAHTISVWLNLKCVNSFGVFATNAGIGCQVSAMEFDSI